MQRAGIGIRASIRLAMGLGLGLLPACAKQDKSHPAERATDTLAEATAPKQQPPPPEQAFKGQARLVNLYVAPDGKTQPVEVWARRSFTSAAVKLAERVEFAHASDWFATPERQEVAVVPLGGGSEAAELGGMFAAKDGEHITTVLEREAGQPASPTTWESGPTPGGEAPPPVGQGLLVLRASQLMDFAASLSAKFGGRSFFVGDGKGGCLPQRAEAKGIAPAVLGGTNLIGYLLPPGPAALSLFRYPQDAKCAGPAVFDFNVVVPDGQGVEVLLYTPDGKVLATLAIPYGLP